MKLRKRKLFSSIAFALSVIMLAVSGAVFVHTATQQSATSSLSVTFSGENVNFTANGWYQVKNTASHPYLVNGNGTEGITIHATDASTTTTLNTPANTSVELSASNTYVLFTYKFTNTASNGAYGMEVTLTGSTPQNSNIDVKYLVSSANATDYYSSSATDEAKISALDEKVSAVTGTTAFSNVFIQAGHHKYFYILVSLKDNTLNGTYNNTLSWNVVCSSEREEVSPVVVGFADGPGSAGGGWSYQIAEANVTTPTETWLTFEVDYNNSTGTFLDNYDHPTGKIWTTLDPGQKIFIKCNGGLYSITLRHYGSDTILWDGSGYYGEIITEDTYFILNYSFRPPMPPH